MHRKRLCYKKKVLKEGFPPFDTPRLGPSQLKMSLSYEEVLDHIVNNKPVPMEEVPDIVLEEPRDSSTVEMKLKPWQMAEKQQEQEAQTKDSDANTQMKADMEEELAKAQREGLHDFMK